MPEVQRPSPTIVSHFLAKQIAAHKGTPKAEELAAALSEIELETQIAGASFIKVFLIDPEWAIATSGFLSANEEGLLGAIEVEFPEKSGWWWRLCALELTNDVTQPNLILTFEDRIIAYLRDHWGEKSVPPGTTTRAQFVKSLVDEVGLSGNVEKIRFVCPSLNVLQPIAPSTEGELTPEGKTATLAKENKTRGMSAAAQIKVKGIEPDKEQIQNINTVMGVANTEAAGPLATLAIIEAAINESSFRAGAVNPAGGEAGVFQLKPSWESTIFNGKPLDPADTQQTAEYWLKEGFGSQGGGIEIAQKNPSWSAGQVAFAVEVGGSPEKFDAFKAEAEAIIHAYGGVTLGKKATGESDVTKLRRGSTENPDEDSWEAITRLASQVDWFAFTNGNNLFYMDGPSLRDQKPALYMDVPANQITYDDARGNKIVETGVIQIPLTANWDNTTVEYYKSHTAKVRRQRKSKIGKPTTPSEVKLELVCDFAAYRAGDVFYFRHSGILTGAWIVTDAVRNCIKDTFTTFTLEPPVAPLPEPEAASTGASTEAASNEGQGNGTATAAVEAAKKALVERSKYVYSENTNRGNNGTLFGKEPRTMDCSSFCTLAYKAGGLPDPSHMNYSPIGNTASMIAHCKKVSEPEPGDFCFFGPSESETIHVTLYVGGGRAIAMQAPAITLGEGEAKVFGPGNFLGYYRPS
jgi:NlpC/P60 family